MHEELYELKEKLIKELGEYSENGKYSKEDVETIKYLASAVDHLCNIVMDMDDEGSYDGYDMSRRMSRDGRGGQGGGNTGSNSYYSRAGRGRGSYARGSYARGRNARRDSRGRYSGDGGIDEFMWTLGEMMGDFPEEAKRDAEKLMRKLEEMQ